MLKKSKYAGLVENGIISKEDLNSAISKASSENKDIESIFLNEMKLSREDIGKSLEHFYNVPYQMYDGSNLPDSMFSGLNINFLRRNNWVPLADEKDSVIILIDDPSDEDKIDNIPQKFSKKKIEFRVGLKSDIHDFLNTASDGDGAAGQAGGNGVESSVAALISELKEERFYSTADADEYDEVTKLH
ncbi:MAG TPA: general secretion pathway protein GspE, partial [Nitrospinaceae bacterium]|nr:general secretion pathway protein GspE [Nitrospinaceae bacterium]